MLEYAAGSLLDRVIPKLLENNLTLSTAESCTGGLLAAKLTEKPGSSRYFLGSVVSYSNEVKHKILGVPLNELQTYGAVSHQVAKSMAEGVKKLTGSTLAISITGIAGPDGGTSQKPVGTVFLALAATDGTWSYENHFSGGRDTVRTKTVDAALDLILKYLA